MARLSAALLTALLLVSSGRASAQTEEAPYTRVRADRVRALAERVAKEVVVVEVTRPAKGTMVDTLRFDGGGFHAGGGRIVTSAFLLEKAERVRVQLPDGRWHDAKLGKAQVELGLAILQVDAAKSVPVPEVAPAAPVPTLGQAAFLASRPATGEAALTLGFWIDPPGRQFYGRTTLAARNGHPLFDEYGRISALTLLPARPAGGSLVAPAWALRRFLGLPVKTQEELEAEKASPREVTPLPARSVEGAPVVLD